MTLPNFTAEASLYKMSRQYQLDRYSNNSNRPMAIAINPAKMKDETIEVRGCAPGKIAFGEGEDMECVDPSSLFGGGHEPREPSEPREPRGPRVTRPAKPATDETPRRPPPRVCDASKRAEWSRLIHLCVDIHKLDLRAWNECFRRLGCVEPIEDPTCYEVCRPEDYQTKPVDESFKRMCVEETSESMFEKYNCLISKSLKDRILNEL